MGVCETILEEIAKFEARHDRRPKTIHITQEQWSELEIWYAFATMFQSEIRQPKFAGCDLVIGEVFALSG